jgi:hypothetical protein
MTQQPVDGGEGVSFTGTYFSGDKSSASPFKLKAWQWAAIGTSAATLIFGGVIICLLVKRNERNKNEIQIELIDDPALTHTLLPS